MTEEEGRGKNRRGRESIWVLVAMTTLGWLDVVADEREGKKDGKKQKGMHIPNHARHTSPLQREKKKRNIENVA